jgi:hypothetical protein
MYSFDDNFMPSSMMNYEGKKFNPLSNEGLKIHQDNEWNYNYGDNDDSDDGYWYSRSIQPYYETLPPPGYLNNINVFKTDDLNSGEIMKKRLRPALDNINNAGFRRSFYFN